MVGPRGVVEPELGGMAEVEEGRALAEAGSATGASTEGRGAAAAGVLLLVGKVVSIVVGSSEEEGVGEVAGREPTLRRRLTFSSHSSSASTLARKASLLAGSMGETVAR